MTHVWWVGLLAAMLSVGSAERQAAPAGASVGALAFSVDGREKSFDHFPDGDNYHTPLASRIRALPSAGAREHLAITVMSIDLKKLQYPVTVPLPKGSAQAAGPLAAMANVGFSYTDESGREWAGPGRILIESFGKDGVVEGTFTGVSLPHTGKTLPNITLTDGTVRAAISAAW